ncbi:MAG TPA: fibronectin type III domain-containing protein [bacterium]|nr:fibronectin type III domain-containing protein [bacterium]HQJ66559.1 fibronectin type III domain-containing protein [bacterium]
MKKMVLILVSIAMLAPFTGALSQSPTFKTGDFVRISWVAPADTDVVKYNAYFINQSNEHTTTVVEMTEWTTDTEASKANYTLALVAGNYELLLTAVDRAGNESLPSDAFTFAVINDLPPGRPLSVVMELVATPQAATVKTSIVKIPAAVKNIRAK